MFICMQKINFIIHFFLEILLQFDWLTAFWPITQEQEFASYGNDGEISTTILVSILDYFHEKLMPNFSKDPKKNLFGGHFGPFVIKFG